MSTISNVSLPVSAPVSPSPSAPTRSQGTADVYGVSSQPIPDYQTEVPAVRIAPGTADALLALGSANMDDIVSAYLRDAVSAYAANRS